MLCLAVPAPAEGEKSIYKLGLILGDEKQNKGHNDEAINAVTDAFVDSRRFTLVERKQLNAVLTEKNLQEFIGGQVNNKLSDLLGLDLVGVVAYNVEKIQSPEGKLVPNWILEVRLIDVKSAQVLSTLTSERASLLSSTTPREAGRRLFHSIREAFPPMGYVVRVDGKEILINLGSEAGVKDGDTLEIVQQGEQIPDPVTGQLLSAPMKVIGELKVLSTSPQISICKFKSKKGEVGPTTLVRLQGKSSLIIEWLSKVPRLKQELKRKNSEIRE